MPPLRVLGERAVLDPAEDCVGGNSVLPLRDLKSDKNRAWHRVASTHQYPLKRDTNHGHEDEHGAPRVQRRGVEKCASDGQNQAEVKNKII